MQINRNPALDIRGFWCCVCHKYLSNWSSMKRHMREFHDADYTITKQDPRFPSRRLCAPWNLPDKPNDFPYEESDWGSEK